MTAAEEAMIRAATSEAVDKAKRQMATEHRVYPAPLAKPLLFSKCRWCNRPLDTTAGGWWVRVGFCSHACVDERYDERGD